MRFSKALNELIRLAEIKKIDLAEILDYDNSYISKWCNDHHLPNPNYDPMLLERMAGFFARLIYANRNQEELIAFTKRELPLETPEMLEGFIHSLLTASLQNSITQNEKIEVFPKQNKVFTGHSTIVGEAASTLQLISSLVTTGDLTIYSNVNLSKSLLGHPDIRALFYSTRPLKINFSQFITEEDLPSEEDAFSDLMRWFRRSQSLNVSVYLTKDRLPERFVYVKDHCILLFETNDYGLPMVMSLVTDESVLVAFKRKIETYLQASKRIMASDPTEEVNRKLFSLGHSKNGIYANLAYPDSHHVPSSFLLEFLKRRHVPTEEIKVTLDHNELIRRYSHQSPVTFIVSKSMIFSAVLNHELTIGNRTFQDTSKKEINYYLRSFEDYLKNHPNATIYYRSHQIFGNEGVFRTSSIFSNEKTLLVKRNPRYVDPYNEDYFQVDSELYAKAYLKELEVALSDLVPVSTEGFYNNLELYLHLTE